MSQTTDLARKLTDKQFQFLTAHLASKFGLKIPDEKRILLESRIFSRMSKLGMHSLEEYIRLTFSAAQVNGEYQNFIDHVTTHKTFFFRERHQFDFLIKVLHDYVDSFGSPRPLYIWSAGCSTGEEVYTLGMSLKEQKQFIPNLDFRILGTDISVPSLEKAAQGFFSTELENLPESYRRKYFRETTKGNERGLQFADEEIRNRIQLGTLNLNSTVLNVPHHFDFIFCRNVTIYFDARTREEVLHRIVTKLRPGGYLFLGHSETALGMALPVKNIRPTIYQKL